MKKLAMYICWIVWQMELATIPVSCMTPPSIAVERHPYRLHKTPPNTPTIKTKLHKYKTTAINSIKGTCCLGFDELVYPQPLKNYVMIHRNIMPQHSVVLFLFCEL